MAETIAVTQKMIVETCITCGATFGLSGGSYQQFADNHKSFSCPYGHKQHYTDESDSEKAKRLSGEKADIERRLKYAEQSRDLYREQNEGHKNALRATKGVVTKMKKRSAAGMCQCCKRSFENIHDHYKTKHPHYHEDAGKN